MVPMRPGNLRGLVIGGNLLRSKKGIWRVAFLGHETKNDAPLDGILPAETQSVVGRIPQDLPAVADAR